MGKPMRAGYLAILLVPFLIPPSLAAEQDQTFCAALVSKGLASPFAESDRLFYRARNGEPIELGRSDKLSRRVPALIYYVRGDDSERGQRSVLNLKFVYKTAKPISRRQAVSLINNQWERSRVPIIQNDCAGLTIDGYERFHLENTRSYCLSRHFHQTTPVNTLATPQLRESFAFQDMIEQSSPGFFESISNLLISPAKAVEPGQLSTIQGTVARSWIWNFEYGKAPTGTCIPFKPDFPDNATSVSLRVTNHGIRYQPYPRTWNLTLED